MVTKISSTPIKQLVPHFTTYSKAKQVALAVLALAVLGIIVKVGLNLLKGRIQPPPPPPASSSLSPVSRPIQPDFTASDLEHVIDNEEIRIDIGASGYPSRLVEVLGGEEKFKAIPILKVKEKHLRNYTREGSDEIVEGLKPYLEIKLEEMPHSVMRGKDTLGRAFLAVKYRYNPKEESQKQKPIMEIGKKMVDIFLCRDPNTHRPEASHWYLNNERSPETFSIGKGQPLWSLGLLITGSHPYFELC
jgi:hypothetical protein